MNIRNSKWYARRLWRQIKKLPRRLAGTRIVDALWLVTSIVIALEIAERI